MAPRASQRVQDILRSIVHVVIFFACQRVLPFVGVVVAVLLGMLSTVTYFWTARRFAFGKRLFTTIADLIDR
jgi:hypothetical protein